MADGEAREGLAIEEDLMDVGCVLGEVRGFDGEGGVVGEMDFYQGEEGDGEVVFVGADPGVEADGVEDVPGGHGAAVVVAGEAVGAGTVEGVLDAADPVGEAVVAVQVVEDKGGVDDGLVAMPIIGVGEGCTDRGIRKGRIIIGPAAYPGPSLRAYSGSKIKERRI